MKHHAAWMELDADLAAAPGTVSVYCGALGAAAAYTRAVKTRHYAASTMKVAVLAALYRAGLDLDVEVTPEAVRIRKVELDQTVRGRTASRGRKA